MNHWITALNEVADGWLGSMWRACWQGALAIGLVWAICRVYRTMPPRVRCWLWLLVYLKLLIALLWATPVALPVLQPEPPPAGRLIPTLPIVPPPGGTVAPEPTRPAPSSPPGVAHPAEPVTPPKSPSAYRLAVPTAAGSLFLLWAVGAFCCAVRLGCDWRRACRLRRLAEPLRDEGLNAACTVLCGRLGLRQPPRLLAAEPIRSPVLIGVLKPAILLPASLLSEWSHHQKEMILAHELCHLRRHDLLWGWLRTVVHVVFFFHPLVWLAHREWRLALETACDELTLRVTGVPRADYGGALLAVATQDGLRRLAAVGVVESWRTLKRRLVAMKAIKHVSQKRLAMAGALLAILGVVGLVPWRVTAAERGAAEPPDTTAPNPRDVGVDPDHDLEPLEAQGWIVFSSNRDGDNDIYAIRPDGTGLKQLVNLPGQQSDPRWSPDSRKVVYATIGEGAGPPALWVYDWHEGTNKKIYDGQQFGSWVTVGPVWSPDGRRILFREDSSKNNPHITVINADGAGRIVVPVATGYVNNPTWSPDGKAFAYDRRNTGLSYTHDLWIYDFTAAEDIPRGTNHQVSRGASGEGSTKNASDWHPGKRLLCTWGHNVALVDPGRSGAWGRQLTVTFLTNDADYPNSRYIYPRWSPDMSRIVCIHRAGPEEPHLLYVMDADGRNARPMPGKQPAQTCDWGSPREVHTEEPIAEAGYVLVETFDDNRNWQFNGDYDNPNFADYPGIKRWENGPLTGAPHAKNHPYLNIVDGVVSGCSKGYGEEPQRFEPCMIHRDINLDGRDGFEVTFRAVSAADLPNSVIVYLMTGWERGDRNPKFYAFNIYGEAANRTIDIKGTTVPSRMLYQYPAGTLLNDWHTYTFRRLSDGRFELDVDGKRLEAFKPPADKAYSRFSRIAISTDRMGSQIDWLKVRPLSKMAAGFEPPK